VVQRAWAAARTCSERPAPRKGSSGADAGGSARDLPAPAQPEASPERERAAAQAAREAASAVSPRVEEAGPVWCTWMFRARVADRRRSRGGARRGRRRRARRRARRRGSGLEQVGGPARRAGGVRGSHAGSVRLGRGGGAFRVVRRKSSASPGRAPLYALELPTSCRNRCGASAVHARRGGGPAPGPLAARLGPEAALLSRLARGEDASALAARPEPSLLEEGEELEWDASSVEPLLFVWKGSSTAWRNACRARADGARAAPAAPAGGRIVGRARPRFAAPPAKSRRCSSCCASRRVGPPPPRARGRLRR